MRPLFNTPAETYQVLKMDISRTIQLPTVLRTRREVPQYREPPRSRQADAPLLFSVSHEFLELTSRDCGSTASQPEVVVGGRVECSALGTLTSHFFQVLPLVLPVVSTLNPHCIFAQPSPET